MQAHDVSIEQGLQCLSDIVVGCSWQIPLTSAPNQAHTRNTQKTPWFDAECSVTSARFRGALAALFRMYNCMLLGLQLERVQEIFVLQEVHIQAAAADPIIAAIFQFELADVFFRGFLASATQRAQSQMYMNGLTGSVVSCRGSPRCPRHCRTESLQYCS